MKHVSILIPNGQYSIVNIMGTYQIMMAANEMTYKNTGKQLFDINLVSQQKPVRDMNGLCSVNPMKIISEITHSDLIIVPAVHGDLNNVLKENSEIVDWIRKQYKDGCEVASFCIGAYLLAEAGILNGKVCSTHWAYVDNLKTRFPELHVRDENFITEDNGIYTSGGAYAFMNLVLYLIEKFGGRKLSVQIAKTFMIDPDKGSQLTFNIFTVPKNHNDDMVKEVQTFIEKHFSEKFTVDDLAIKHATIRRTLERRFKKATGNSINEYVQRVRIEAAKEQLEQDRKTINEVMFYVGYSDGKAFRDVFKKYVGISPVEYKNKFGSQNVQLMRV